MRIAGILLAFVVVLPADAAPAPETSIVARAVTYFAEAERKFDALKTLDYTVERTTYTRRISTTDRWRFRFRQPGDVRVDYLAPQERVLILADGALVEFVPAMRRAIRTRLSALTPDRQRELVGAVLARVSVDGLRMGDYAEMATRAARIYPDSARPNTLRVEGQRPRYIVSLDTNLRLLLTTEIWNDQGLLVLRTVASDPIESPVGCWWPQRIEVAHPSSDGGARQEIRIRQLRVDSPLDAGLFRFSPPQGVTVDER